MDTLYYGYNLGILRRNIEDDMKPRLGELCHVFNPSVTTPAFVNETTTSTRRNFRLSSN